MAGTTPPDSQIRAYRRGDAEALAGVYRDAVRGTGAQAYDAQQVAVWSSFPEDVESFRHQLAQGLTLLAEVDGRPVAFGQLEPIDHVAFLYTASAHGRRGLALAIYRRLESHARAQGATALTTDASRISRCFFAKLGFAVEAAEVAVRRGTSFERFAMRKTLV